MERQSNRGVRDRQGNRWMENVGALQPKCDAWNFCDGKHRLVRTLSDQKTPHQRTNYPTPYLRRSNCRPIVPRRTAWHRRLTDWLNWNFTLRVENCTTAVTNPRLTDCQSGTDLSPRWSQLFVAERFPANVETEISYLSRPAPVQMLRRCVLAPFSSIRGRKFAPQYRRRRQLNRL